MKKQPTGIPQRKQFYRGWPKGQVIAEVGVAAGNNAQLILDVAKPRELWLIDAWTAYKDIYEEGATLTDPLQKLTQAAQDKRYVATKKRFAYRPNVHVIKAHSLVACELFEPGYLDIVYIDGVHVAKIVYVDMLTYWKLLGRGGRLTGHDFTDKPSRQDIQVQEAVKTFCWERKVKLARSVGTNWEIIKP